MALEAFIGAQRRPLTGSAERLHSLSLAGKGMLEAHALVALLLAKETHVERCAGLRFLLIAELLQGAGKRRYGTFGLGITWQSAFR